MLHVCMLVWEKSWVSVDWLLARYTDQVNVQGLFSLLIVTCGKSTWLSMSKNGAGRNMEINSCHVSGRSGVTRLRIRAELLSFFKS